MHANLFMCIATIDINYGAAFLALCCILLLIYIFAKVAPKQKKLESALAKKYRLIYRVVSLPDKSRIVLKTEDSDVQVGDYGWEAEAVFSDGLVYLHGLNEKWQVVWYVAFLPNEVEVVCQKPRSQYYCYPYWMEKNIPTCPYVVKLFGKKNFGFPVKIEGNWIQGRTINRNVG